MPLLPQFGPGVRERFQMASRLTAEEEQRAAAQRAEIRLHLDSLLGQGTALLLPTAPGPAPLKGSPLAFLEDFRVRNLSLTCIAGLGSLPQVTMPLLWVRQEKGPALPVGLSLVGPRGSDEQLLGLAEQFWNVTRRP